MKDKSKLHFIAIIGMVAIVAVVMLTMNKPVNEGEFIAGDDLAGQAVVSRCFDSDYSTSQNKKLTTPGYVRTATGVFKDMCRDEFLVERYCTGTSRQSWSVDCSTVVQNGICRNSANGEGYCAINTKAVRRR